MPKEGTLLPLTERIERTSGTWIANLFDDKATLAVAAEGDGFAATSSGALMDSNGTSSGVGFTWIHRFAADGYSGEATVTAAQGVRMVIPFVDNPGNQYALAGDSLFRITTADGGIWELKVTSSTGPFALASGEEKAKYWSPFPGMQCHPLAVKFGGTGAQTVKYSVSQTHATGAATVTREIRGSVRGRKVLANGIRAVKCRGAACLGGR